jgi:hypothetical protein
MEGDAGSTLSGGARASGAPSPGAALANEQVRPGDPGERGERSLEMPCFARSRGGLGTCKSGAHLHGEATQEPPRPIVRRYARCRVRVRASLARRLRSSPSGRHGLGRRSGAARPGFRCDRVLAHDAQPGGVLRLGNARPSGAGSKPPLRGAGLRGGHLGRALVRGARVEPRFEPVGMGLGSPARASGGRCARDVRRGCERLPRPALGLYRLSWALARKRPLLRFSYEDRGSRVVRRPIHRPPMTSLWATGHAVPFHAG